MTDKKTEALKLALEALEGMYIEGFTQDNSPINNAITAIREALAEQPAPPPECKTDAEKTAFAFGWWKALEENRKQPAQQQEPAEPSSSKYNEKRIAWELERTAMGDGYYGNALYVAMDMVQTTRADREMLHRYMHGANLKTDHVKLQDLAMRIYTSTPANANAGKPWVGLTEQDRLDIWEKSSSIDGAINATAAKLKEKNHG